LVCHNRGGGAERHLQEDTQALLEDGWGVFYLRPDHREGNLVRLACPSIADLPNLGLYDLADTEELLQLLKRLGISRIHTHGLVDFRADAPILLSKLVERSGMEFWVDIHDYKVICPRINLVDEHGKYCGEPAEQQCNKCLKQLGSNFGVYDIGAWRRLHHQVLGKADRINVPDQDVAERLKRYFPDLSYTVEPHEEIGAVDVIEPRLRKPNEKLRVVVIGAISDIKGYEVLLECAKDAKKRKLPIEFVLMGYSKDDAALTDARVQITGRYAEEDALEKLQDLNAHIAFFPALWPETYSYTLSIALAADLPVFAFDIGAIARRYAEIAGRETLIPLRLSAEPRKINQQMLAYATVDERSVIGA